MYEMDKNTSVTLTTATTAASTSNPFYVTADEAVYVGTSSTLNTTEVVQVQISVDGSNYLDLITNNSTAQCSTDYTAIRLVGPAIYKTQKTVTSSTISVHMRK